MCGMHTSSLLLSVLAVAASLPCAADPAPADGAGPARSTGPQYGVCAHLYRVKDPEERAEECAWIAATGIGRVRFDFEWRLMQKEPGAPFDFSHYDAVVADAARCGLTVLPILFGVPSWADPVWEHPDDWAAFVEAVVAHYGDAFPDVEIWNEENLRIFWKHAPDPARYLETLRVAYAAAKRANPRVRVLFGGTAGVPLDFIGMVYELGGADCFDAMNVHPYSHPAQPERSLDARLEALRALMAEHGDADKPIVITELGWPTHDARVDGLNVLRAGLAVACPERKTWRAVYAATAAGGDGGPPRDIAEAIERSLPPGSAVEACFGARLRERLAAGDVDLVVYPFGETFPVDTFDDVLAFVERGGVLADLGGMPLWYPVSEPSPGVFAKYAGNDGRNSESFREKLGINAVAWWIDPSLPREETPAFPTAEAKAAGYLGDPAGERGIRFQTPKRLGPGDEFVPLLALEGPDGRPGAVAASVTRRDGGRRGCLVLSGVKGRGATDSAGEDGQARYLARAMAIAFAEGVDQYFWYEFRSRETDPQYSEHHFGLTHRNFTPKPAWGVYRNFVLARPEGSVQTPGAWHAEDRTFFFPQWTRPDGTKAGILWKTGPSEKRGLAFDSADVRFRDHTGRLVRPIAAGSGRYTLEIGENPVFFEGGALVR